jgi:hypothetical protein
MSQSSCNSLLDDPQPTANQAAVFIVAASSRLARARAERLVVTGLASLRGDPDSDTVVWFEQNRQVDGHLHVWSVRDTPSLAKYWARIRPADWLLFYQMGFITIAARVARTLDSEAIAGGVWGPDEARDLRRLIVFDECWPIWASVWPHRDLIGARFLGFRRVAEARQEAIRVAYGSADGFARKALILQKRPPRLPDVRRDVRLVHASKRTA